MAPWRWPKLGALKQDSVLLEPLSGKDAEFYHAFQLELRKEPDLTKFLGLRQVLTVEEYREFLGSSLWEIYGVRKDSSEFGGVCGFLPNAFVTAPEIYIWLRKTDRRGKIGTESGKRLIEAAFEQWECDVVVGVPHPENYPSIGLLKKLGMKQCASIDDRSMEGGMEERGQYDGFPIYCKLRSTNRA